MEPSCPAGTLHALQLTPATSQIAPERLSDLALSHSSSPLSHLSHQVTKSPLPEGTNGTLMPRRDAPRALSALSALAHSSDLSDRYRPLESPRPKSLSIAPNSPLFEGDDEPSSPAGPLHAL